MKIEEYLGSLPQNIITGDDVQLPERSLRDIFNFVKLGEDDVFYHPGCGDGLGLEIARREFHAKKVVGVDSSEEKISAAKGRGLDNAEVVCGDLKDHDCPDATVVLFWFTEEQLIRMEAEKFRSLPAGCRVVTVWEPLPGCRPDQVRFPYLLHRTPFTNAGSMQEQVLSIFGVKCIDFVTAWEYAERYTKAVGSPETRNDRFLTIMQAVVIWINAKNIGVACGEDMPEPIKTYISILRKFFGIEVEHLLKK